VAIGLAARAVLRPPLKWTLYVALIVAVLFLL
jgi:hypothetical protein